MDKLKCDKPYNVDEARRQRGLPRRKRANPKATCYELAIRIPPEYQAILRKKKATKTVYAMNKKGDLRRQVRDFEDELNAKLEVLLSRVQVDSSPASSLTGESPLIAYISRYVERCVLAVPRLSEEWALEKRREYEENRRRLEREGNHRKKKPFGPLRVGGPDLQHKVLKFLREVLNDAVDRGIVDRNVAKSRFLSKSFKKGRPLIDPLSEEDAARFLSEVKALPLCSFKVEALLLFSSGMRPEEMLGVRPSGLSLRGTPSARITGAVRRDSNEVEECTKSSASRRTVPLDRYTADTVAKWLDLKKRRLRGMGVRSVDGLPVVAELDSIKPYSSFINEWHRFIEGAGFEAVRPYALRHTFATLNLAYGENIKTISVILGHATPSYTLDLYVGYIPATSAELSNRYMGKVASTAA